MSAYNREQLEAIGLVRNHLKTRSSSELSRLRTRIRSYLRFRKETARFLQGYFSEVCTHKCYRDHHSACCGREGITTFFADVVINALVSSDEEIDRLVQALQVPNVGLKCVYLGKRGCLWRIKPIVCEMFLCEDARKTVFGKALNAHARWERLRWREKRYTWPDRPVLFDDLETVFIQAGCASNLMYFHNSPGLLKVKSQAMRGGKPGLRKS
ncbi:MAG: hypothetical protein JRJ47_10885 [Deltaproteobacteria bacterium]|nr:hypothetical protein [Deltaproteobacteria bacterium]